MQFERAVAGWTKAKRDMLYVHECLHYVLLHLAERWRGYHLLVLVLLRKRHVPEMCCIMVTLTCSQFEQVPNGFPSTLPLRQDQLPQCY